MKNHIIIIFSVIYFILLASLSISMFFMDEIDNFLGASMEANGSDIYSHHISQHMPFAYYFFAVPAQLLKINSLAGFRISFYVMLIIIWVLMYFRYKDKFGKSVVLLYPILYIFSMDFLILQDHQLFQINFRLKAL